MLLNLKKIIFIIINFIIYINIAISGVPNENEIGRGDGVLIKAAGKGAPNDLEGTETEKKTEKIPDIAVKEPNYDFGSVFRGSKVEHIFGFKNEGQGELNIKRVSSSCGCTAAVISSQNIPYNEYGEVKVAFNSQAYTGNVTKKITVYSNDPDTPKYVLTISGNVVEEIIVEPKMVDFSQISYGVDSSKDISVKSADTDLKLKIKKVEATNPNVITTFNENKEKNEYIVNALLKNDTDYGRINGNIFVYTNSKNQEKIIIPFYGEVIGDLSVYPPRISCGTISRKKEMVFPAFVIVYNQDVNIERVEITPDFIDTAVTETKSKRKTYKIEAILKENAPLGEINGNIKIFTNSKKQPVIEIPVIGTIKEG